MLDRHQQAIRFHQLVEHVLENVLSVARIGHAPSNEVAQPGLLPLNHFGDPLVLFDFHQLQTRHVSFTYSCRRMRSADIVGWPECCQDASHEWFGERAGEAERRYVISQGCPTQASLGWGFSAKDHSVSQTIASCTGPSAL